VVELPAPVAGTILSLDVEEGRVVPVGTRLLTIEDAAQDMVPKTSTSGDDAAVAVGESAGASVAVGARRAEADGGGRWSAASVAPQRRALATPAVRRLARELGVDINPVVGSGPAGRVLAEDVRAAATGAPPEAVTTRDVEAATAAATAPEREARGAAVAREARAVAMPGEEEGPAEERLPLRGLRRRIAENMVLSVSTIPQVTSLVEVDATALVALRRSVLPAAEARGIKLSYLPFVVKALVQTLRSYPYVNATIDEGTKEIVLKRRYHIGIATATPDGLLVPVLRHADRLTVLEIASELARLAEAARERKLGLDELRGSTFTITNYGAVGGYFATPIINPGEAAILGLGRITERPWAVDGRVEARPVLPLSFTADHRLIDGELAIRFLNTLVASLENPNLLLLYS
jgi:pyruvate dehydrogenase E2 component (dihydrolipoamide acetyltransferase)